MGRDNSVGMFNVTKNVRDACRVVELLESFDFVGVFSCVISVFRLGVNDFSLFWYVTRHMLLFIYI